MTYFSRVRQLYHKYIRERDKEGLFLVLVSFTLTFIVTRIAVYSIKYHWLPHQYVGNIIFRDMHIHHLVFGIMLLLIAGIIRIPRWDDNLVRFSSLLYGIGAALTLDEFSLWLRLNPDAYFGPQGRISIDAVVVFTLIVVLALGYERFWRNVLDHTIFYFFIKNRRGHRLWVKNKKHRKKVMSWLGIGVVVVLFGSTVLWLRDTRFVLAQTASPVKKNVPVIAKIPVAQCSPTNPAPHLSYAASVTPAIAPQADATQTAAVKNDYCLTVPVLYYHHTEPQAMAVARKQTSLNVDSGMFDQQMAYLVARGYTTITADQLVEALHNHISLPPKSVVLTFDDGYEDIYDYAFPIFQRYHLIANLAIPTGLMGVHADTNDYFSWDKLKTMVASGLVFANNHTWSHAALGLGTVDKNQFEITTAEQQLTSFLGKPVITLVYPYGSYKPWVFSMLQKAGILGAFTTYPGTLQCSSQIYALHRTRIANAPLSTYGL